MSTPNQFGHGNPHGLKGGPAFGQAMREKRELKWQQQYGVSRDIGQKIYDGGFQAGYQSAKRRYLRAERERA